ncbi:hypothetical protein NX059_005071 [Plenodomus lindquistii]|nr:hypothetical protein NX059_005071 [Plenodomus lindquistii]
MASSGNPRRTFYQSLGRSSIRLLSINPGFPSEPLECAFVTVANLSDSPSYDALSYVWGTELNAQPIICNGVEVKVTRQLGAALNHLRRFPGWGSVVPWPADHPLHSRRNVWKDFARNRHEHAKCDIEEQGTILLWVDALCINQEDASERAEQVKMMGKIYARATNVKIWLGEEDKEPLDFGTPSTLESTHDYHLGVFGRVPIVLSFIAQALRNANGPKNRLAARQPMEDSAHRNRAYGFLPPDAPEWDVLRQFFANGWFARVWVVQEVVLSNRATALIGDWEIDWAAIGQAAVWFQSKGYAIPAVLKYQIRNSQDLLPVFKAAATWKLCLRQDRRVLLLELLHEFRSRLATNAVDKVYATFGMAAELTSMGSSRFDELVEPDYSSKSVLDVYRDIARFIIVEHGDLTVLSHAGTTFLTDWPSWVPDWRHEKASNALSTSQTADIYNASEGQPLCLGYSRIANALPVQGIEVDYIVAYSDRLASYGFGYVTYQEEVDFVQMASALYARRPFSNSYTMPGTDFERARMIIQTLTANLTNTYSRASEDPEFQADALAWLGAHAPNLRPSLPISQYLSAMMKQRPDPGRFHEAFVRACVDRRFFVTKQGLMGIGPNTMKEGDILVILFGGRVPYLLRASNDAYRFLGECYVPGMMNGEEVQKWRDDGSKRTFFELV